MKLLHQGLQKLGEGNEKDPSICNHIWVWTNIFLHVLHEKAVQESACHAVRFQSESVKFGTKHFRNMGLNSIKFYSLKTEN